MNTLLRSAIRRAAGEAGSSMPIIVKDGDQAPQRYGKPYWKTNFTTHGGRFQKTLYTPSTQRIEVGREWPMHVGLTSALI